MLLLFQAFHDLDVSLVVEDDILKLTEELGRGAFGTVYAGQLQRVSITTFMAYFYSKLKQFYMETF